MMCSSLGPRLGNGCPFVHDSTHHFLLLMHLERDCIPYLKVDALGSKKFILIPIVCM